MICEISDRDRRIDDFLQSKLAPEDAEIFEIHLFGCPECLEEMRLREQMVKLIKEERVISVENVVKPLHTRQLQYYIASEIANFFKLRTSTLIYVGVAAAVFVAIFVLPVFRGKEVTENFAKSPQLEGLMQQSQRSSDISISVSSPRQEDSFTGEVLFHWQTKNDGTPIGVPIELKVLNNQEVVVHNARVEGEEYRLQEGLTPGLYYWTLEYQGEMVYLGKFFIR